MTQQPIQSELPARKTAEQRYKSNINRHYRFDWRNGAYLRSDSPAFGDDLLELIRMYGRPDDIVPLLTAQEEREDNSLFVEEMNRDS